jgi:hypothetical protein
LVSSEFDLKKDLRELERSLGLPEGFIERLEEEDDWSFVIKAHALVEAAMTQLLVHELHKPQLGDIIARLDMTAPFGKLAFGENPRHGQRESVRCDPTLRVDASAGPRWERGSA